MAIAFGTIGTKNITATTSAALAYPASIAAGDMFVAALDMYLGSAGAFDAAPAGWTQTTPQLGGTGTAIDAHNSEVCFHYKEAVGGESGTQAFTQTGGGGMVGAMQRYTKGAGETWSTPFAQSSGDDATHAADRSVTGGTAISLAVGDVVVALVGTDTDAALTITSPAITASGITFGTTTRRSTATAGNTAGVDGNYDLFDAEVTAGSGTVAPILTFTTATTQCGPVAFLRLRVTAAAVGRPPLRRRRFFDLALRGS